MKTLFITILYLTGAFSSGFDSHGTPYAQNCYFTEHVYRDTKVNIQFKRIIKRRDFASNLNNLQDWQKKVVRIRNYVIRHNLYPALIYAPPLIDSNGVRYIAGGEIGVCDPLYGTAVVFADDYNDKGESRIYNTQVTAAHEIGHLLGASHDNSEPVTIMNQFAAAPGHIHANMRYSDKSKKQILTCLRQWRIK